MSPTTRVLGPCRFFFYSGDLNEPPHIHVERERATAKFWLEPVSLAASRRFPAHELRHLEEVVHTNANVFLEAWHEFYGR